MKTQISRDGFRADRRYSGVYQQQGRMITDRDWNELVDILKARMDEALVDVIGNGTPKGRAATVQIAGNALKIVPGAVYAGGVEARLTAKPGVTANPFDFADQADFPSPPPLPAAGTAYRIYADVWERTVVSLEDEDLRDPALHGADTCTRTQTMAQVKWCPVAKDPENPAHNPGRGDAPLTVLYPQGGSQASGADPCDPQTQAVDPVGGDFLFRVEVHDVRWPAGAAPNAPDRVVIKWSRENGAEQYQRADAPDWFKAGPWFFELHNVAAEKHLGFHLANAQGWTPQRGTLSATFPVSGDLVRRWDGYAILVRSGNAWSLSNAAGEDLQTTAPGSTGQVSNGRLTLGLADLEVSVDLAGKVFLPGDFWAVPVRSATYQAGGKLLDGALPQGIVHRYVTLAEVQTNGQLKTRTAQEQRKLAFPRLSELDAGDMGYSTNCNSGLFDSTHDTVKKALDRLCAINGTHVGYTKPSDTSVYRGHNPNTVAQALNLLADVQSDDIGYVTTCTSGLFDNTHDTVKKALDRLCAINATHVGFTKPSDTSLFQGVNPATVAQALNLLADVKSEQIAYTPDSNPAVHDVRTALDELYARPVQNGSRVYIGPGGQYATLNGAINDLVAQGKKDIALALLPGDHTLSASWSQLDFSGVHLNILGLGRAARLRVAFENSYFYFDRFASVCFQHVHLILANNTQITFNHCGEVVLLDSIIEGSRLVNKPLILMDEARRVEIRNSLLDSQWETTDSFVTTILGLEAYENIADLFSGGLTEFRVRARNLAQTLHGLPAATRNSLSTGITNRTNSNNALHIEERNTYHSIASQLQNLSYLEVFVRNFAGSLEHLRRLLYVKNPGTSIQFSIYTGPTLIQGNQIRGVLGFIGLPKNAASFYNRIAEFLAYTQGNRYSISNQRHAMQVIGNVMAGMRFGETLVNLFISSMTANSYFNLSGPFRTLDVTGNIIENEDNHFLAEEVNLHGNQFTFHPYMNAAAAWVVASNATYFDNRSRTGGANIYNGVPAYNSNSMENANFRLIVVSSVIG